MQTFSFYSDGRLTIRFCGELDHAAAASAMRAVTEAAGEYLPRTCVLDLSGLTFMDSSGIAVILRAQRLLNHTGAALTVESPPEQARRVLELAGLGKMVEQPTQRRREVGSI